MTDRLAALRAVRDAATQGKWEEHSGPDHGYESQYSGGSVYSSRSGNMIAETLIPPAEDNATFIATFDPELVGKLLDGMDVLASMPCACEGTAPDEVCERCRALAALEEDGS